MNHDRNIARARAYANIAFIKYWGNRDHRLRLPANASLSMNLASLHATTSVEWTPGLDADRLRINGFPADPSASKRVSEHLTALRQRFGISDFARVDSVNNFPMGTGIASSAAAFAALTLAAAAAASLELGQRELSILARLGSGSASRSIPPGFVHWRAGDSHEASYAETIAPADHWELVDIVALVSRAHKRVGSSHGHQSADSSVLQSARVASVEERLTSAREAILRRDFAKLAAVVEEDSNLMHAVMMTSQPPLFYWQPLSLRLMKAARDWREEDGLAVCYTLDAGPNVHLICEAPDADAVRERLRKLAPDLEILLSPAGGGAHLLPLE